MVFLVLWYNFYGDVMYKNAIKILNILENNGYKAYIVGGYVRDKILNVKSNDIDIITNALPDEVCKIFNIEHTDNFGSIKLKYNNYIFEVTTFRKEYYKNNDRRPYKVEYIDDLKEDLMRRDFTINSICIDKNEDYIYDYVTYSASETSIPYINLNTEFAKVLNGQLEKLSSSYKSSNSSTNSLSYRFNVSGNYLSLVLIFKKMDSNNRLQFDFKSYVFDLSDGARALSDTEILNLFNIDNNYVEKQIDNKLKNKYLDEVKKDIISSSKCDYNNCYLKLREVSDLLSGVNYYIENDSLVVYRSFQTYSIYDEQDYFTRADFRFLIK